MSSPIRIHPENPKLFDFRGRPLVLLTATEHYGAVMNRPFRIERYLEDAARCGHTLTRLFTLFRELQAFCNPYSTCKPETTDYVAPWERVGPEPALDFLPKWDLDRPNPEFHERLDRFMTLASEAGVIVELVLFSNTYAPQIWQLNPLNAGNHVNGDVEEIPCTDYTTLRHPGLLARQEQYARRVVEAVNRFDNLIIEICNEPGGHKPGSEAAGADEVNDWLKHMIGFVREVESALPNQHLIVGQESFAYPTPDDPPDPPDVHQYGDQSFDAMDYDVVNMHPLSNLWLRGRQYNLGPFMRGRLRVAAVRDYCLAAWAEQKPVNLDEDNAASQWHEPFGWTIHRKRAWTAAMCGAHYDVIDFSVWPGRERGVEPPGCGIRAFVGHLARFVHRMDLAHARPLPEIVAAAPKPVVATAFGVPGREVAVYLPDAREAEEPGCGEPIAGELELALPAGAWRVACYDPKTGVESPAIAMTSDGALRMTLPEFAEDIVVVARA